VVGTSETGLFAGLGKGRGLLGHWSVSDPPTRRRAYKGRSGRPLSTSADSLVPNAGRLLMLKSPLFKLVVRCGPFFSMGSIESDPPMSLLWRIARFHMVRDQSGEAS